MGQTPEPQARLPGALGARPGLLRHPPGEGIGSELPNPDVAVTDRVAMVLQLERQLIRVGFVTGLANVTGRPLQGYVILNQVTYLLPNPMLTLSSSFFDSCSPYKPLLPS